MDYEQTGGARWNACSWFPVNVTWPFAKLYVNDELLSLSVNALVVRRTFVFKRAEVVTIHRAPSLFSSGVQIEHTRRDCPTSIVFWTFNLDGLREQLVRRGYRWV